MEACQNGDTNIVARILNNVKDFNIEVTDNMGKSGLRLAIENENFEVKIF